MRTFHIDEPREIGKKRVRVSPKDMMVAKKDLAEKVVADNTCVNCGNIVNENLRKWFKQKWVNIGKKKKGGGHPPCGTSGKKRGYAKCVPASKAASMTKKQKASATRRKRAAQNKAGRGGTSSIRGGGKKPIRVKTKAENVMNLEELVGKPITEAQFDEAAGKKDACYHKVKARYDVWPSAYASGALVKCRKVGAKNWGNKSKKENVKESFKVWDLDEKCWKGYEKKGMKTMFGKRYPNCVKKEGIQTNLWLGENEIYWENNLGESCGYTFEFPEEEQPVKEADYQGRKVKLGKIMQGDTKKFKVYVKNPKGNVVKVNFGQGGGAKGGTMKESQLEEAEYQGRKVKLGKPMQGDTKKFKVYVKNDKGNVVKVNFGQGGDAKGGTMRIRKSNPKARKAFRARHNCDNPGPRHKARYWSCRKW